MYKAPHVVGQSLASLLRPVWWGDPVVAGQLQTLSPASLEHVILTAQFFINQKFGAAW
jgi:hypothetical protein